MVVQTQTRPAFGKRKIQARDLSNVWPGVDGHTLHQLNEAETHGWQCAVHAATAAAAAAAAATAAAAAAAANCRLARRGNRQSRTKQRARADRLGPAKGGRRASEPVQGGGGANQSRRGLLQKRNKRKSERKHPVETMHGLHG